MKESVAIREADAGDDVILARIIARSFLTVAERFGLKPENCPKHPSNCAPDWIRRHRDRGARYFILEVEENPGGCVALAPAAEKPGVCYVERLAVSPALRGRGYGVALMDHAHRTALDRGAHRVEIAIIAEQHELAAWYERRGYVATGTRRFEHLPFLVMFMTCDLVGDSSRGASKT
jgi:GNAT superfamily N-acetyltransferase